MAIQFGSVDKVVNGSDDTVHLQFLLLDVDMAPCNAPTKRRLFGEVSDGYKITAVRFHDRLIKAASRGDLVTLAPFDAHLSLENSH